MRNALVAASVVLGVLLVAWSTRIAFAQLQRPVYNPPHLANLAITHVILPVPMDPQETGDWCWAASAEMAMNYLAPCVNAAQCNEANGAFGLTNACQCPTPAAAIRGGWPDKALNQYGFTFSTTSSGIALSWTQVVNEIATNGRPFVFTWGWNSTPGWGHAMTAIGVTSLGPYDIVAANNPWPPYCQRCGTGAAPGGNVDYDTYADFVGGSGYDHSHWSDYYNIGGRVCRIQRPTFRVALAEKPAPPISTTLAQALALITSGLSAQSGQVNAQNLGLSSSDELRYLQPRPPIPVVEVNLRALSEYQTQENPSQILISYHALLVPVAVAGAVQFGITVTQVSGGFRDDSFGASNLTRAVYEGIQSRAQTDRVSPGQFFLIEIPALSVVLVARRQGSGLLVAPVFSQPQWELRAGQEMTAQMAFGRLSRAAAQVLASPRACE